MPRPRTRVRALRLALAAALSLLSACAADDLDCSLGAMKPTCPPETVGFDRMAARLRVAQRRCLQLGLESGADPYRACLAAADPAQSRVRTAPFNHLGGVDPPPAL